MGNQQRAQIQPKNEEHGGSDAQSNVSDGRQ
jgi:hypothetical protein